MGADLFFMLADKTQADEFNKYLENTEQGARLARAELLPYVTDTKDIEWAKSSECNSPKYFQEYFKTNFGKGVWKASGLGDKNIKDMQCETESEIFTCIADMFAIAQKHFKVYFYAGSCALKLDGGYFSIEDMRKMTKNGKYLKAAKHNPEKSSQLLKVLKAP